MDNYQLLANAIVERAAKDYRKALIQQKRHPNSARTQDSIKSLEDFFQSDWYAMLTQVDGKYLMERIQEAVNR